MHARPLSSWTMWAPAVAAVIFVAVMSLVREPTRRSLNAILVAGASGSETQAHLADVLRMVTPCLDCDASLHLQFISEIKTRSNEQSSH